MVHSAYIKIWNKLAGAVVWYPEQGLGHFEFHPDFFKTNWDISPIFMPLAQSKSKIYTFQNHRNNSTYKGLPGLLADVLPDKYGNALINTWLARHGRPNDSLNPVEMLCFIGKRGMGALEFEPVQPQIASNSTLIELNDLIGMAQHIVSGKAMFKTSLSKEEDKALLDILKIGTSAGGARAKAVIAYNPLTKVIRSGQANAPEGFSHWLIKFDGVHDTQFGASDGYGRVEMAYYLMAQEAGINMMPCQLLEENGRAHFMTRRFDRTDDNEKIHIQSFCAMMHFDFNDVLSYSYEQLFQTMRILRLPYQDAEQLFIRMVFNVLSKNCDDHTKNFSFMMHKNGEWRLSPAYDVCHAYRPGSQWVSQQSLSVNGKRR
ncbi:MAG: type II toxin-antitoxin system HipA family toxin, partial [Bacteroidetes bacterium]|nr:type II toxin-antitoxin system HipA family toxin [Bacteroidota bacterium]